MNGIGLQGIGLGHPILSAACPGGGLMSTILSYNPIVYFPINESSGTTAINYGTLGAAANGAYTGVTLAQPGIGDGNTCGYFDGNDKVNIFSTALAGAFNGEEGTFSIWLKGYGVGFWTGGVQGIGGFRADLDNYIYFYKQNTVSKLVLHHVVVGYGADPTTYRLADNIEEWVNYTATWSYSSGIANIYINGILMGTDTNIGQWVGPLTVATLGLRYATYLTGYLAHAALWNNVLSDTRIISLSKYGSNEQFGGVVITFDDIFDDAYPAFEYMRDRRLNSTQFVASFHIDASGYWTHEQIIEAFNDGWTIGNHTVNHATLSAMTEAEQIAEIQGCKDALAALGVTTGSYFAFPYGGSNQNASTPAAFTACGILCARVTERQQSIDTKLVYPYWIPTSFYVDNDHTLEQIKASVNTTRTSGGYWSCVFHGFTNGWNPDPSKWDINLFKAFIDWLISENIPCLTIADLYALTQV